MSLTSVPADDPPVLAASLIHLTCHGLVTVHATL